MIICCCCLWEALRGSVWGAGASSVARRTPRRGAEGPEITAAGCRERDASTALDAKLGRQHFSARAHAAAESCSRCAALQLPAKARRRTDGSAVDSRSWLASDDPYGSFADFARRVRQ